MMQQKIDVYEPASMLTQVFRVAVITGGVAVITGGVAVITGGLAFAIVGGLIINGLEWISGGGND